MVSIVGSSAIFSNGTIENIFISEDAQTISIFNSKINFSQIIIQSTNINFIFSTKSYLHFERVYAYGNNKHNFSMIISKNNNLINIDSCLFAFFYNIKGAAIFNEKTLLHLNSSSFISNEGIYGGAIYSANSNITFLFNVFLNNSADYGAAIYFYSDLLSLKMMIEKNNFTFGSAKIAGGGFYTIYFLPELMENIFINNSAIYGNNYASSAIILSMKFDRDISKEITNYLPSSQLKNSLVFSLVDAYNNSINLNLSGKAFLSLANQELYEFANISDQSKQNKQIFGEFFSEYTESSFIFRQIKLNFKPNSTILLKISSDLIKPFSFKSSNYLFPHYLDSNNNYYYILQINSTECPIGIINFFLKKRKKINII